MSSTRRVPRVLITNDDGPPGDSSPFVYPFARALVEQLGWEVRVVVPSSQKSWCVFLPLSKVVREADGLLDRVGKSYLIAQTTTGVYYYPTGKDGREGERSELPRPLKEGEEMEWVLVDGTPGAFGFRLLGGSGADEDSQRRAPTSAYTPSSPTTRSISSSPDPTLVATPVRRLPSPRTCRTRLLPCI